MSDRHPNPHRASGFGPLSSLARRQPALRNVIAMVAIAALFGCQSEEPPELVHDRAGTFAHEDVQWIGEYHRKLLEQYDIDYRIVTAEGIGDIAFHAHDLFARLDVGAVSRSGRGLLLVIDVAQDQVRLEVGGPLEPIYTDAFVGYIQSQQMVPFFAAGRVADGVLATSELIFSRAREAASGQEFMPPIASFSAGGGAQTGALIGRGKTSLPAYPSQTTPIPDGDLVPLQIVDLYVHAMNNRDADFTKRIYTADSQAMMQTMVVTPAQMENAVKAHEACGQGTVYRLEEMAVVRYPADRRDCFPYFLRREQGRWKLDFVTMSDTIRFNHDNYWHLNTTYPSPVYRFAFGGWTFDRYGYAHNYSQAWLDSFRWQLSYQTLPSGRNYVTWVGPGSPAQAAGLRFGDEIVQLQGDHDLNTQTISRLLDAAAPGEVVHAIIARGDQRLVIEAVAPTLPPRH